MTSKDFQVRNGAVVNTALSVNTTFIANASIVFANTNLNVNGVANVSGNTNVTGNANVGGNLTVTGSLNAASLSISTLQGNNLVINVNAFVVNSTTNFVGIGTTAPVYSLDNVLTGGERIPVGTTAQRPTAAAGVLRFNSDFKIPEVAIDTTNWVPLLGNQPETGAI